ncbi:MAG: hypothetical protein ACO23H_11605 [Alphaproteobacteria bacterium]
MIAETLAVIGAANAAIGQVKTLIGHGQDISAMGRQLGAILTAEETLKAQGERKKRGLFAAAMGKDESSFEEFLELDRLKEARKEIESMMRIYGRAGLYQDWVDFQRKERVRKREEAEEQAKARAFLVEVFQWCVVVVIVVGGCAGLIWWAWVTSGR